WVDTNCDDTWQPGETASDRPDGAWVAGYGVGRPALGINSDDGIDARVLVVRSHGLTVALVALDLVGYFHEQSVKIRALVKEAGDAVDLVLVSATHTHEGPDVIGMYGRNAVTSGVDLPYIDFINRTVADTIHDAVSRLEPATLTVGSTKVEDMGGD